MPQAIAAAIAQYGVSAGVYGAGSVAYTAVYWGAYAVATLAIAAGTNALLAGDQKSPDSYATTKKDPKSPRKSGYGRNRIGGSYMLWETQGDYIYDVVALHDGRMQSHEAYWLNDDKVILAGNTVVGVVGGSDDRYRANRVRIYHRLGLPVETSYTADVDFSRLGVGVWTANHRGDGVSSVFLRCQSVEQMDMPGQYPNGQPTISVEGDCLPVWDWRTAQNPADPFTWQASYNPIVQLADYLTSRDAVYVTPPAYVGQFGANYTAFGHGMGLDRIRITAALADWTLAANICEEPVPLKAGGTEPRYESHGVFEHITSPAAVIAKILETCDGWLTQRGDGALTVNAGRYVEPEVVIPAEHIIGYSLQRFVEDEQRVDGIVPSFTSPAHDYAETETDLWGDPLGDRLTTVYYSWVHSNSQTRRLAKRGYARAAAPARGTFTTDLYGLMAFSQRYVRFQCPEVASLANIRVEVSLANINFSDMTVKFEWVQAEPNIDAWSPATEEGDGPALEGRVIPEPLETPSVLSAVPFFEAAGTDVGGVRLRITADGPDRGDLTWFVRWRVVGAVSWKEDQYSDIDPAAAIVLETGFVPADAMVEVQVAYATGGRDLSLWSDPSTVVNTSTATVAPAPAADLETDDTAVVGEVMVSWRNPGSVNFDHARVWRGGPASSFGSAADISGPLPGSAGALMAFIDTPAAGSYRYWVTAENAANAASAPVGPETATVP